jgi:hypothetical protein
MYRVEKIGFVVMVFYNFCRHEAFVSTSGSFIVASATALDYMKPLQAP